MTGQHSRNRITGDELEPQTRRQNLKNWGKFLAGTGMVGLAGCSGNGGSSGEGSGTPNAGATDTETYETTGNAKQDPTEETPGGTPHEPGSIPADSSTSNSELGRMMYVDAVEVNPDALTPLLKSRKPDMPGYFGVMEPAKMDSSELANSGTEAHQQIWELDDIKKWVNVHGQPDLLVFNQSAPDLDKTDTGMSLQYVDDIEGLPVYFGEFEGENVTSPVSAAQGEDCIMFQRGTPEATEDDMMKSMNFQISHLFSPGNPTLEEREDLEAAVQDSDGAYVAGAIMRRDEPHTELQLSYEGKPDRDWLYKATEEGVERTPV
jgi:hypothetical protein